MLKTKISPPKTLQIKTVPWRKNRGPGHVDLTVQLSSVLISTEIDFFEALTKKYDVYLAVIHLLHSPFKP